MLSTCPSVSASSTRPEPSQTTATTPSQSRSAASSASWSMPGIAVLLEQALLRGHQRARPVDGDRAAFEDDRAREDRLVEMLEHPPAEAASRPTAGTSRPSR
jgi:hypothetical protein